MPEEQESPDEPAVVPEASSSWKTARRTRGSARLARAHARPAVRGHGSPRHRRAAAVAGANRKRKGSIDQPKQRMVLFSTSLILLYRLHEN